MKLGNYDISYEMYRVANDQNKRVFPKDRIAHIDNVVHDSKQNALHDKVRLSNFKIKEVTVIQLIMGTMKQEIKVTNPSTLDGWRGWNYAPQMPIIRIKKEVGKQKDAFKLLLEHDLTSLRASIPYFLRPYIEIKPNGNITEVSLTALEGTENITVQVNGADDYVVDGKKYKSIAIAFEEIDPAKVENAYKLPKNQDGKIYNVWWKKNADTTLIFKDGRFYTKENTVEAQFTTDSYPKFLGQVNDRIKKVDGGWLYKTSWSPNPLKATNYRGFWVKYGEQDFNYLEIGTPSADAYIVVDKNDNKIGTLNEYFAHIVQNLRG